MPPEFKILVIDSNVTFVEKLKQQLPLGCSLVVPSSLAEDDVLKLVGDVDIIVSLRVSSKLITAAQRLKMIQSTGSGVDRIDVDAATERGIIVCSTTGLNAVPVAEHALALMLALAKNITRYDRRLRSEGWVRMPTMLLRRKTLGIVGLGSVGVEVARRTKAFEMSVLAVKRRPTEELRLKLEIAFLGGQTDLPLILRDSDFVVICVPLTPETRKMIGERELRMMKKSAYLVNVSRGGIIDEDALVRALAERIIAGAGLDVFEDEPLKTGNPLLKLENVVLTPHAAGSGEIEEVMNARVKFIVQNIERVTRGQKPEKIVDPVLKYVVERR